MIPINVPIFDEDEYGLVKRVMDERVLTNASFAGGSYTQQFEKTLGHFIKTKNVVAVSSGTAALHLALLAIGIKPEDEVIIPSMTFIATANAVKITGAKPVFADIDNYYTLDVNDITAKITKKTKAIIPVHLYGHTAEMQEIMEVARDHNLYVIEDAAQSLGSYYKGKATGTIGHIGCYSFYSTKVVTTGEGGALATDDAEMAYRLKMLRNHGYSEDGSLVGFGLNYRMGQLNAAIGTVQLKKIDKFLDVRKGNAQLLNEKLEGVIKPSVRDGSSYNWYLYTIRSAKRTHIIQALYNKGIDSRVYYDPPAHLTKSYDFKVKLPLTEQVAKTVLSLPTNPMVSGSIIEEIIHIIKQSLN